jgi:hypothetical protein
MGTIMGGRGAASGVSAQGYRYGTEFKTLMSVNNIKFVQYQNNESAKIPKETMSSERNRVYALINRQGNLKSITFYGKDERLRRQIDLDHKHGKEQPHAHSGYEHLKATVPLTKGDMAYIEKVRRIWALR